MTRLFGIAMLSSVLLAACGGATAGTSGPKAAAQDPTAACVALFQRQRACTDTFIPALVDARVKLNVPAGIADDAKQQGGRDAIIAKAKEEWKEDSKDDAIKATCDRMVAAASDDEKQQVSEDGASCVEKSSCDEFTTCVMPLVEAHLASR
jgi:hypothetical protein